MKLHPYRERKVETKHQIQLKKYKEKGICPFCSKGIKDQEIIKEGDCFYVIYNKFPYKLYRGKEIKQHLLLIPKDHVEDTKELSIEKHVSLIEEWKKMKPDETIYRKKGDEEKSIPHAHIHLIYF